MHVIVSLLLPFVAPHLMVVGRRSGRAGRVASSRSGPTAAVTAVTPSSLRMTTMWWVAENQRSVQHRLRCRPMMQMTRMGELQQVRTLHGAASPAALPDDKRIDYNHCTSQTTTDFDLYTMITCKLEAQKGAVCSVGG